MSPLVLLCSTGRSHAWCNQRLKKCSVGILESTTRSSDYPARREEGNKKRSEPSATHCLSGDSRYVSTGAILCVSALARGTTGAGQPPSSPSLDAVLGLWVVGDLLWGSKRHLKQLLLGLSVRLGVGLELRMLFSSFLWKEGSHFFFFPIKMPCDHLPGSRMLSFYLR